MSKHNWFQIILMILLVASLLMNYVLKSDNEWLDTRYREAKFQIYENIIGPNYCDVGEN